MAGWLTVRSSSHELHNFPAQLPEDIPVDEGWHHAAMEDIVGAATSSPHWWQ